MAREIEKHQSREKLLGLPKDKQNLKGTVFMILEGDNAKTIEKPIVLHRKRPRKEIIFFSEEDIREIKFPHLDPLVISPIIGEFLVQRVLVDTGTSVDIIYIIYWDTFKNLGLEEANLTPD